MLSSLRSGGECPTSCKCSRTTWHDEQVFQSACSRFYQNRQIFMHWRQALYPVGPALQGCGPQLVLLACSALCISCSILFMPGLLSQQKHASCDHPSRFLAGGCFWWHSCWWRVPLLDSSLMTCFKQFLGSSNRRFVPPTPACSSHGMAQGSTCVDVAVTLLGLQITFVQSL